jgi:hypothetical protein
MIDEVPLDHRVDVAAIRRREAKELADHDVDDVEHVHVEVFE